MYLCKGYEAGPTVYHPYPEKTRKSDRLQGLHWINYKELMNSIKIIHFSENLPAKEEIKGEFCSS